MVKSSSEGVWWWGGGWQRGEVKIAAEGFSAYAFFDPSPISSKESKTFPYSLPKFHMSYASVLQPKHFWFESSPKSYYEVYYYITDFPFALQQKFYLIHIDVQLQ